MFYQALKKLHGKSETDSIHFSICRRLPYHHIAINHIRLKRCTHKQFPRIRSCGKMSVSPDLKREIPRLILIKMSAFT